MKLLNYLNEIPDQHEPAPPTVSGIRLARSPFLKTGGELCNRVMRLFIKSTFLLSLCLLLFLRPAVSYAGAERTITSEQWQKLTDDHAFGYKNDKEKADKPREYKENAFTKFVMAFIAFLASDAGLILAWVLAISIIIYILYKLFGGNGSILFGKNKRKLNTRGASREEEDIATTNWDNLVQQAIQNNDLRLAVRYSYMRLLQLLQQHELIAYRADKTNYEYYTELNDTSYKQPFKQLSRQYEYTWYGHYLLAPDTYNEYMRLYNNVKKQLGA